MSEKQKTSPNLAFISLGSNINPESYLPRAIESLHTLGKIMKTSKVYQNAALDRPDQSDFLNAAVLIEVNFQPLEIRRRLRRIETELDRIRTADKYAPRTLDLDLCLLGNRVFLTPELSIPDPDIMKRPHIGIPLSELDVNFVHPISCTTLGEIAQDLTPGSNLAYREDITLLIKEVAGVSS